MTKKFLSILISITMIASILNCVDFSACAASTIKETWDDGYIVIKTVDDLIGINDDLSAKYRLANDIDLSSVDNWVPIGDTIQNISDKVGTGYTEKSDGSYFCGVLDGANHKIINLSINKSLNDSEDATNVYEFGLFAHIVSATIENLIFENVYIDVDSSNLYKNDSLVGALAGSSENSSIINCYVKNSELSNIGGTAVSGVVGYAISEAYTTFDNVINYSNISGGLASGIASGNTRFEYCANAGQINGGTAGGISAGGNVSLSHCYNTGEIMGKVYSGGIVGLTTYEESQSNSIQYCNNYGTINMDGSSSCGGIVGKFLIQNKYGIVKNCNNFGTINYTPNNSVGYVNCCGGIIGESNAFSENNIFENCTNYGDILADLTSETISAVDIGGICGAGNINQLNQITNYGNIISNSSGDISICAGGICGSTYCHNANDVYNYGDLTFKNVNQIVDTTSYNTFLSVGGLFAQGDSMYIYENIGNEGNIIVNGNIYRAHIGGLFQNLYSDSTITNAYNTGNISVIDNDVSDDTIRIGGIFACYLNDDNSLNISNVYSSGDISLSRGNYTGGKVFIGNIYGENPKGGTIKLNNFYAKSIKTYGDSDSNLEGQINIINDFSNQNNFNGFDFTNTWTLQNGNYPTIISVKQKNQISFLSLITNNNFVDKQTIDYEVFSDIEISKYYFGKKSSPNLNEFIETENITNLSLSYEIDDVGYYNLIVVDKDGNYYSDGGKVFYEFDFVSQIGDTVPSKILVSEYIGSNGFAKNYFILPMPNCQKEIFNGWSSKNDALSGIFVLTDDYLDNYTTTLYATYDLSNCSHPTTYEWVEIEQSCTQDGYTYDRCTICDEIVEQHIFKKTGHNYKNQVINPTCTTQGYTRHTCTVCGDTYNDSFVGVVSHTYSSTVTKEATCTVNGVKTLRCTVCGDSYTETITALGHNYKNQVINPTCTAKGYTKHACSKCGYTYNDKYVNALGHSYRATTNKATTSKNGSIVKKCSRCGQSITQVIYYPKTISLSAYSYTYDGKVKTPSVTVKDSKGNTLKKNTYYTISYASGRKSVGRYSVKITFKGNYYGTVTKTFDIKPKTSSISSISSPKKRSIAIKWKTVSSISGYEVQVSTSSNFSKNTKTYTAKASSKNAQISKELKGNVKYYVRIRTFKNVKYNGKNIIIYSSWSSAKSIKTKG
ncbi:MAG: hypothetical protein ACI4IK_01900 [Eubacterium sp.]